MSCAVCTRDVCAVLSSAFVLASCQTCTPDNENNITVITMDMEINFVLERGCRIINRTRGQNSLSSVLLPCCIECRRGLALRILSVRLGMIRWEWEGNGNKKVVPAHLYSSISMLCMSRSQASDVDVCLSVFDVLQRSRMYGRLGGAGHRDSCGHGGGRDHHGGGRGHCGGHHGGGLVMVVDRGHCGGHSGRS